jgi:PAS domain S-box-containing protein
MKLLLGFVSISLLVVILGLFSYHITREIVSTFRGGEEHFRSIIMAATEATVRIKEAESLLVLYVTLGDEGRREEFQKAWEAFNQRMIILDERVKAAKARKVFGEMKQYAEEFSVVSETLQERYRDEMSRTGNFETAVRGDLVRCLNDAASKVREAGLRLAKIETDFLNKQAAITAATETASFAKRTEAHLMLYLTSHDPFDKNKFFERSDAISGRLEVLRDHVETAEGRRLIEEIAGNSLELRGLGAALIDSHDAEIGKGAFSFTSNKAEIERLHAVAQNIADRSVDLVKIKTSLELRQKEDAEERARFLQRMMTFAVAGAILVTLVLGYASAVTISRPLRRLRNALDVVGKGRFDASVESVSHDEVGDLGRAFNSMVHELEQSRSELLTAKDYLDGIIRSMNEGLIVVSHDCIIQTVNKAAVTVLGYDEKDLVGRPMDKVLAMLLGRDGEGLRDLLGRPIVRRVEKTCVGKDGSEMTLIFSNAPLYGPGGDVQGVVWVVRDVTERKMAEEALKKSEEQFRLLFEHAPIGVAMGGLDGRLLRVNRAFCSALGYDAEELLQMKFAAITHPDDITANLAMNERLLSNEIPFHQMEKRYIRKDGTILYALLTVSLVRDAEGSPLHFIAHVLDFTARKKADEALEKAYRHNQLLLDAMGEGLYGVDKRGRATFINSAALGMLGYEAGEVEGASLHELIHHTKADGTPYPATECLVYRSMKEGRTCNAREEMFWRKDGTCFPVEFVCTPIKEHGQIVGAVVVFVDISERKRMEEELLRARKIESVAVLASGVAHDFNNLLTGILTCLSLAKASVGREAQVYETLLMAEAASRQAKALTHELFSVARMGGPRKKALALEQLVTEATRFSLSGTAVQGEFSFAPDLWPVEADEGQLSRVIHNLVINAAESMPGGGTVTVSAENVTAPTAHNLHVREGDYVRITVRDQGAGIPRENLDKIFDPYFTTKQRAGQRGMGLGLTVCYLIAKAHDGFLEVDSKVGEGTAFHVYLPAKTHTAGVRHCVHD